MADETHEPVAPLSEREQFFYDHGGYSFKPGEETREQGRRRCARELAAAEQRLNDGPFFVAVERDPEPMEGKSDEPQWIVGLFTVAGVSEPMCLGSLGAVDCPADDPYLRVVAADLADELIPVATAGTIDDGAPNIAHADKWLADACEQLAAFAHKHNDARIMDLRATILDIVGRGTVVARSDSERVARALTFYVERCTWTGRGNERVEREHFKRLRDAYVRSLPGDDGPQGGESA